MDHRTRIVIAAAALLALADLSLIVGCSKDSNPTDPGNGGGGNLELNSGNLAEHQTYAHTFMTAGTFPYHCAVHSGMRDTVTVQAGGVASTTVDITGFAFSANPLIVAPGGTVTWTNHDTAPHTVTSDSPNP